MLPLFLSVMPGNYSGSAGEGEVLMGDDKIHDHRHDDHRLGGQGHHCGYHHNGDDPNGDGILNKWFGGTRSFKNTFESS